MYGYSCVYTDTMSWETPTKFLPMVRDPRMVFDQLFGVGGSQQERAHRRQTDRSILDWLTHRIATLKSTLGPADRQRMDEYLENIREIERRITRIEQQNSSGEARQLPTAPIGVPDDWDEHVKLMFDLQLLAFVGEIGHNADVIFINCGKLLDPLLRLSVMRSVMESGTDAAWRKHAAVNVPAHFE